MNDLNIGGKWDPNVRFEAPPEKEERTTFVLWVIVVQLIIIAATLGAIYHAVHAQGTPVIMRQCITIDAPAGTTRVGCGP
jgi:hypothetical protein